MKTNQIIARVILISFIILMFYLPYYFAGLDGLIFIFSILFIVIIGVIFRVTIGVWIFKNI